MSLIYETPGTNTREIIVVGVGYKIDRDRIRGLAQWAAWRTRDLTLERSEATEQYWKERLSALLQGEKQDAQSDGAPLFLKSLREEIIPFVEANYRASFTERGLVDYSFGGLFTLYVLFHAPQMFTRYLAGSPTMWDPLFQYEENYASKHDNLRARLFITAGGLESDLLESAQRMVERLRSRGYPRLEVLAHVFEGVGHSSALPLPLAGRYVFYTTRVG
jgi:predicted alpha/beta superfamily hydrolase